MGLSLGVRGSVAAVGERAGVDDAGAGLVVEGTEKVVFALEESFATETEAVAWTRVVECGAAPVVVGAAVTVGDNRIVGRGGVVRLIEVQEWRDGQGCGCPERMQPGEGAEDVALVFGVAKAGGLLG